MSLWYEQVTKEGLAARVVDKQQVHRTMSKEEILHLFDFGDEDLVEKCQESLTLGNSGNIEVDPSQGKNSLPHSNELGCSDWLMRSLLSRHRPRYMF